MVLSFSMSISKDGTVYFSSYTPYPEYKMLEHLFSNFSSERRLDGYQAMLEEVEQIERGEILESPEPWGLVDAPDNEFRITREVVNFEMLSNVRGWEYLQMPTAEFKGLLLKWIKFIEINTAAFSRSAKGN